jgi:hypothetical protein
MFIYRSVILRNNIYYRLRGQTRFFLRISLRPMKSNEIHYIAPKRSETYARYPYNSHFVYERLAKLNRLIVLDSEPVSTDRSYTSRSFENQKPSPFDRFTLAPRSRFAPCRQLHTAWCIAHVLVRHRTLLCTVVMDAYNNGEGAPSCTHCARAVELPIDWWNGFIGKSKDSVRRPCALRLVRVQVYNNILLYPVRCTLLIYDTW